MQITNTNARFGIVAIFFHWLMAFLLIGLVALGLYMKRVPVSVEKLQYYGWHKEFGILVLMLVIVRLTWRLANATPSLIELPWWEKYPAQVVHYLFYIFMFALPITGWLMTSAAGLPVSFFGLFALPNFVAPDDHLRHLLAQVHKWLAYGLIATFCLHVVASLKHHFINQDNILRRMLWP